MTTTRIENESRRSFLGGVAGLTLAIYLPSAGAAAGKAAAAAPAFEPNAFLRIGEDNSITVISKHLEMGQGTYTGLATIVAEELDADWSKVRVESAPADHKRYNNLSWGPAQGTGGSSAMANSWEQLRRSPVPLPLPGGALDRSVATWMDDGFFARWAIGAFPSAATMAGDLRELLGDPMGRQLLETTVALLG